MKYIESKPNGDGTYDHTEVQKAHEMGCIVFIRHEWGDWVSYGQDECPLWHTGHQYRAQVPSTYGIHESSSTLREVKGDAGPAVAEMLLDRISEVEKLNGEANVAMLAQIKLIHEQSDRIKELEDDLSYALGALNDWACYGSGADPEMDAELIRARAALNKEQK